MTLQEHEPASAAPRSSASARRLFWASAAFYILIAFEFFYMASPFAAYFYAVYGPGMDWLQQLGLAEWTLWFFLPHLVEQTRSGLINHVETAGFILFFGGLLAFAIGAFQIYRAKLRKANAVMGGLYRYVRHPQYAALIVASLGMLLIWPRFLVLFSTITVIFAYIALARAEEAICLRQYPGYGAYRERTGMFLPTGRLLLPIPNVRSPLLRVAVWIVTFCVVVGVLTAVAFGLRGLAISSLYTHNTKEGVYLSVVRLSDEDLAKVARIARSAPKVQAVLGRLAKSNKILAYIVPTKMYISEIPMYLPPGESFGHSIPPNRHPAHYKIIFTKAEFGQRGLPTGGSILAHAVNKHPLIEVHVDLASGTVQATHDPPKTPYYNNRQVPLF